MSHITPVFTPDDYPTKPDAQTQTELATLFASLFPGQTNPRIDESHAGVAIAAHSPALALKLSELSRFMAIELPWCQSAERRELVIQSVNIALHCDYGFNTRLKVAEQAGLSLEQQNALMEWESCELFSTDQKLIVEYTLAVAHNEMTDELSQRFSQQFGERATVEISAVAAFWGFWALFLNATY